MEIHIQSTANVQDFFKQGEQFLEAAWRCFGKKNDEGFSIMENGIFQQLPAPCVVNAAFACEMFLKSLLCELKIKYNPHSEGHNLFLLYKKLPSDIQKTIAEFCRDRDDTNVFEKWLKNHANDFVDIRYFMERDSWTEMSPMMVIQVAYNLSMIVGYLLKSGKTEGVI